MTGRNLAVSVCIWRRYSNTWSAPREPWRKVANRVWLAQPLAAPHGVFSTTSSMLAHST